jgi:hypothetical protein
MTYCSLFGPAHALHWRSLFRGSDRQAGRPARDARTTDTDRAEARGGSTPDHGRLVRSAAPTPVTAMCIHRPEGARPFSGRGRPTCPALAAHLDRIARTPRAWRRSRERSALFLLCCARRPCACTHVARAHSRQASLGRALQVPC